MMHSNELVTAARYVPCLGPGWGPRRRRAATNGLPFVYLNVAMTADGKIAPATRRFSPISSARDRQLMLELRTYADAVMSGARTIDLSPVTLSNGGRAYTQMRIERGLRPQPLRIVVSGAGTLDPGAAIFKKRFSPILVLACGRAPERRLRALRAVADEVAVFGSESIDFAAAFRWLHTRHGVRSLLCEGGGEVNAALFQAGLVDELYLTICPVILGGGKAPTISDGSGFERLADAAQFEVRSHREMDGELFLICRPSARVSVK